ncbi:MAG TPA: PLP-dependent aminotransferase family protein [Trebonia sp.]|nr:PLP-dependent aminotransferase family protein [Trebonia sp.]
MTEPINGEVAWIEAGQLPAQRITATALTDLLGYWSAFDGPLYRLLANRIGRLADTSELPPGLRLPPERELATVLSVSRNTVAMAYQLLRDEGMAESRQGSGTRIMPHRTTPAAVHRANGYFARLLSSTAVDADLTIAAVDCAPQVAAALDDPATVLSAAQRQAATSGIGYFPSGYPDLRAAIATMLTTRRALPTRPEQIIVTNGAQQALDLLIRCELVPGQPALVEDPTFPAMLDALQRAGSRPVGVPPGDVDRLERAVITHRPGLAYLIATYHNPVGLSLPLETRQRLVTLARAHPEVVFIDDQVMASVTFTGVASPPPLAALAPALPNLVTVGSLSKTYWGGLRTGWIRASAGMIARLSAAKATADLGSTAYQQAIVAALIARDDDEIVRWRAGWLRPRYEAVASALREFLPDWQWTRPEGGLTIWARLPESYGADSGSFAQAALRNGVALVPGRLLSTSGDSGASRHVRLAFTQPPETLQAAIKTLASIAEPARISVVGPRQSRP